MKAIQYHLLEIRFFINVKIRKLKVQPIGVFYRVNTAMYTSFQRMLALVTHNAVDCTNKEVINI
jgi:hypothetical protein